jgi:hypothetical protein
MTELSRRRFLQAAGAGGLGLVTLRTLAGTAFEGIPRASATTSNVAKLGVFAEPAGTESGYLQAYNNFVSMVGRPVDVYRTYRGWGQPLFNKTIDAILASQSPPEIYVSFHAFFGSKATDPIPWAQIAAGDYDAQIDSWAQELLRLGRRTYVCFHHEMENEEDRCGPPEDFLAAYWHFRHRIEIDNGVTNLTWLIVYMRTTFNGKHGGPDRWWPDVSPDPDLPADQLVGVDIYNRYFCHNKNWQKFEQLTGVVHDFSVTKNRRLFIGECGCVEGNACDGTKVFGSAKARWFDDALTVMKGWDNLEALCYSQVVDISTAWYRIDSSPQSQAHFATLANDPMFGVV